MKLKDNVKLLGIKPELLIAIIICNSIYQKFDIELVITSCVDGKHSKNSLHYSGNAVDIRISNIPTSEIKSKIFNEIKNSLTQDYDLIDEQTHFHLEYQPSLN